jgi:hypothetical protein
MCAYDVHAESEHVDASDEPDGRGRQAGHWGRRRRKRGMDTGAMTRKMRTLTTFRSLFCYR